MSSRVKGLVIGAIVLVFLAGTMVVLKLTEKSDADSSSASSSSSVASKLLYEEKQGDVQQVEIKNQNDEYTVVLDPASTEEDPAWTIEEWADLPLNGGALSAITSSVASVTAQKVIEENAPDLSKYGLTDPAAEVKVTFKDSQNTVKEFLLGDKAPTSGQTYFAFKGENTVYTVTTASFSTLTTSKLNAIDLTPVDSVTEYPVIKDVDIRRADLSYPVQLAYDPDVGVVEETKNAEYDYSHRLGAPFSFGLDSEESTPLLRSVFGLTADSAAMVYPAAEDLEAAGFSAPTAVVTTQLEDRSYTLTIGARDEESGNYYGMLDGIDVLYLFAEDSLPWVTFKPMDLIGLEYTNYNITNVEAISVTTPDSEDKFDISGESDDFKVLHNGAALPDSELFRKYYQYLLLLPAESVWLEEPAAAKADATVTFHYKDGHTATMEYYKTDNRQSIIKHDGVTCFKGPTAYVERLFTNIEALLNKGDIILSW